MPNHLQLAVIAAISEFEAEFVPASLVGTAQSVKMIAMMADQIVNHPDVAALRNEGIAIKQAALALCSTDSPTPEQWAALKAALGL